MRAYDICVVLVVIIAATLCGIVIIGMLSTLGVLSTQGALNLPTYAGGRRARRSPDVVKDLARHPRSKSEAHVIEIFESILGEQLPTVNPAWLVYKGRTLELDGYSAASKIAVEFSGPLHTKWAPSREPYQTYFGRIMRDRAKLRLCAEKGVTLIVIDMSLPVGRQREYILSRLADIGRVPMPVPYHPAQVAEVYRNESLERELGLCAE